LICFSGGLVVFTDSFKEAMDKLDIAFQVNCPILIEGDNSVGKSTLIEAYAALKGIGIQFEYLAFVIFSRSDLD
jgi:MoxR-like ATPase